MTTPPSIRELTTFTHRALAAAMLTAGAGLVASFATQPTVQLLGLVALCSAAPTALVLNTIAARLALLDTRSARTARSAPTVTWSRHAA